MTQINNDHNSLHETSYQHTWIWTENQFINKKQQFFIYFVQNEQISTLSVG